MDTDLAKIVEIDKKELTETSEINMKFLFFRNNVNE